MHSKCYLQQFRPDQNFISTRPDQIKVYLHQFRPDQNFISTRPPGQIVDQNWQKFPADAKSLVQNSGNSQQLSMIEQITVPKGIAKDVAHLVYV